MTSRIFTDDANLLRNASLNADQEFRVASGKMECQIWTCPCINNLNMAVMASSFRILIRLFNSKLTSHFSAPSVDVCPNGDGTNISTVCFDSIVYSSIAVNSRKKISPGLLHHLYIYASWLGSVDSESYLGGTMNVIDNNVLLLFQQILSSSYFSISHKSVTRVYKTRVNQRIITIKLLHTQLLPIVQPPHEIP